MQQSPNALKHGDRAADVPSRIRTLEDEDEDMPDIPLPLPPAWAGLPPRPSFLPDIPPAS
jgi:hypothetical protein